MRPNIKRIYMAWRQGSSHRRIIIGEIKPSATRTTFRYIREGMEEAYKKGLVCYPDFPDIRKIYDTNITRILSQRINNADRTDIKRYYDFWEIKPWETTDTLSVLAHTGGILPTDNFEFLAEFYSAKGLSLVTELAGLSENPLNTDIIKEGDALEWHLEPDNPYDDKAVWLSKDGVKLGYVKKIHNRVFHLKGARRLAVIVKSVEHNGHIRKAFLSIQDKGKQ